MKAPEGQALSIFFNAAFRGKNCARDTMVAQ